jgi:hypothetical protein
MGIDSFERYVQDDVSMVCRGSLRLLPVT